MREKLPLSRVVWSMEPNRPSIEDSENPVPGRVQSTDVRKRWRRFKTAMASSPVVPTFDYRTASPAKARRFVLFLSLLLVMSILTSLYFDLRGLDTKYRNLAAEMGRSFFNSVDSLRQWNFSQGGIYAKLSKLTPADELLQIPDREVTTTDGMRLTLINHARMIRLLSELLGRERQIHVHLTDLSPIRPENAPDEWERRALVQFRSGNGEEYDVVATGGEDTFRYMAPLNRQASCVACHAASAGASNVLGGISISFPYGKFETLLADERRQILIVHAVLLGLGLGVILLVGGNLVRGVDALQDSMLHIKRLEGLLPICANCKKVRLEGSELTRQDSWMDIEQYIRDHTDAEFTHGLCPACAHELYPTVFAGPTR
jgi:hypothetical protein